VGDHLKDGASVADRAKLHRVFILSLPFGALHFAPIGHTDQCASDASVAVGQG
jgi:hypothetical protein